MKKIALLIIFVMVMQVAWSQAEANYDESKVPDFELPDPLKTFNGKKIRNSKKWTKKGRQELLDFFTENVYGEVPGELKIASAQIVEQSENALNGKAKRRQVELTFKKGNRNLHFFILMYLPKSVEKAPVFLGYNFYGNHTITEDVNVIISEAWSRDNPSFGIINNQLTEQSRGVRTNRWAIEKMIDAGIGLATIYYGEVDPDKDDFTDGVHPFFYVDNQQQPAASEWGSISAWSWGLSRALDYFETYSEVDENKVIVFGHSRLGKTSLWAGASDERFAGVISNCSGCGGAALSKRKFGETVGRINSSFPHWFCKNFRNFNNNEEALPVDQHELLALIAPRPLYVASAEEDQWADPKGEFLSAFYASKVYDLFDKKGITSDKMPAVNEPIQNTVSYHIRTGKHDVTDFDWEQYINWAKEQVLK
ncbi:acetylxylan esterase [Maribellus comscasis]|uniref:Acetylxylan esterase n=1 Tax=Maribellus comscasis TaxID=2681766 RepID=A0A6I6JHE8_9BACT|nr:acetylxylan esterase [Maribellus comscasis]QGY42216.1 acetylxylan esterase [Maribellus comscasis]